MTDNNTQIREKRNNLRLSCPHCGAFTRLRSSERFTRLYWRALVECRNAECGWRGTLNLEISYTLTPSQTPDPDIRLPISEHSREAIITQLRQSEPVKAPTVPSQTARH